MKIRNKERLRELRYSDEGGVALDRQLAYLVTYGSDDMEVEIQPDSKDPYISVLWFLNGRVWMNGALVRHDDGTWSVHT